MSLYDTIRCLRYDPVFAIRHHADGVLGGLGVVTLILIWGAL